MTGSLQTGAERNNCRQIDPALVLSAIGEIVLVVGDGDSILFANPAAEHFFSMSAAVLKSHTLGDFLAEDSILANVVDQARRTGANVLESEISLEGPRIERCQVSIRAGHLGDTVGPIVVSLHERSITRKIDRQLLHRTAARSVTAMAQMLAHEVKNPLSGIRGAAQLLAQTIDSGDRKLTQLICDETDRIVRLVDRMEVFSDGPSLDREPVNIHEVLHHVHDLAHSGFSNRVRLVEDYDPSLPPVIGNRDQLIQVFLNLVKNAGEALLEGSGEIVIQTSYNHGMRVAPIGGETRIDLPLKVTIRDSGTGVSEDLYRQIFDPFVTTKQNGSGLGLALVAKIINDHGGIVDLESIPGRTEFHVLLPLNENNTRQGE